MKLTETEYVNLLKLLGKNCEISLQVDLFLAHLSHILHTLCGQVRTAVPTARSSTTYILRALLMYWLLCFT